MGRAGLHGFVLAQVMVGAVGAWAARLGGFSPLWFTPLRIGICAAAGYVAGTRGRSGLRAGLIVAAVDAVLGVLTLGYGAQLELSSTFASHRLVAVLIACVLGTLMGGVGHWLALIGGQAPSAMARRDRG